MYYETGIHGGFVRGFVPELGCVRASPVFAELTKEVILKPTDMKEVDFTFSCVRFYGTAGIVEWGKRLQIIQMHERLMAKRRILNFHKRVLDMQ